MASFLTGLQVRQNGHRLGGRRAKTQRPAHVWAAGVAAASSGRQRKPWKAAPGRGRSRRQGERREPAGLCSRRGAGGARAAAGKGGGARPGPRRWEGPASLAVRVAFGLFRRALSLSGAGRLRALPHVRPSTRSRPSWPAASPCARRGWGRGHTGGADGAGGRRQTKPGESASEKGL